MLEALPVVWQKTPIFLQVQCCARVTAVGFGVSSARQAGGRGSSPCQWAGMGFHVPQEHTWSFPSRVLNIPKRQEQQPAENTRGEYPGQQLLHPLCLFKISTVCTQVRFQRSAQDVINPVIPPDFGLLLQILNM